MFVTVETTKILSLNTISEIQCFLKCTLLARCIMHLARLMVDGRERIHTPLICGAL